MTQRQAKQHFKRSLLVSAVLSALGSITLYAQESIEGDKSVSKDIERIMVTASKRLQGLQEPLSPLLWSAVKPLNKQRL